ncbi:28S ribosomal protein S5, mitochondrial-like isoform X2 [Gigantopelta aegis]|uniref:28S ribosomal protein S5, mitochondrial-like isoform X2 n=1 Tax=Gigantopelta aegis TaxID=1735272 RepID=UPI001B887F5E|nr:28S ribosomal protein S5, mitochondrial-like isoform X2 [Gigantopelta aegis]
MAACVFGCRAAKNVLTSPIPLRVSECVRGLIISNVQILSAGCCGTLLISRNTSFYTKLTAEEIWKGIAGLSNPGRKRGRGRKGGAKRIVDLNRGQMIGEGAKKMVWPGLNAPVMKGRELIKIKELAPDPNRIDKLLEARKKDSRAFRTFKIPTLQRGWSDSFEGFDTRVLELKLVANMTGNFGRKQRFSAFVVTGNKQGLAGYALAKAPNIQAALRKAKNVAAQHLQYVELYKNHTVFHNFYTKEEQTAIMVRKESEGHGLVCHRALKTICGVIGIKDMYAKVEGSTGNIQRLTKAFFDGLRKQETHQELADRLKLHIVELREDMDNIPVVVASPSDGSVRTDPVEEEDLKFENLYFRGRVPYIRPKPRPFFESLPSWRVKRFQLYKIRNQAACQQERKLYGMEPSNEEFQRRHRPLKASREV